jgi:hypothetical protein
MPLGISQEAEAARAGPLIAHIRKVPPRRLVLTCLASPISIDGFFAEHIRISKELMQRAGFPALCFPSPFCMTFASNSNGQCRCGGQMPI